MTYFTTSQKLYMSLVKRPIGFFGALVALILLSPVFLVTILLLFFANKGAGVFFTQDRPGKNEKIFKALKFKTMTDERDAEGNLLPDADRLTPVGKFVRSTSIDELPQLITHMEQMQNAYVGIGVTIQLRDDGYIDIVKVESGGPAEEAGILVGDMLVSVNGLDCKELGMEGTRNTVRGEEGTTVDMTFVRDGQELNLTVERRYFEVTVAELKTVHDGIGIISIYNFDDRCADETIAAIEQALDQGANKLIFDVRNNPGGYKHELVEVLDYLLPEGPLFRSENYLGKEEVDESGPDYLDVPMAVLVNIESYSAAEFFAAAMSEYDAAVIVGSQTYGKGYFQQTYQLADGSAVGLSVGKYYTPNGVSLAGVGITPDVVEEVDDEMFLEIYYGNVEPLDDPQILAAIEALKLEN